FGVLLHLGALALVALMLPNGLGAAAVREAALPALLALPIATATLGVLLKDLLERDKIEQALRFSEARLRAIGQAIPDPLLVVDEDGRCLDVICSERNLLYDEATRLRGKTVQDAMPEADQQRYLDYIRQTLNSDTPQLIEYSLPTRVGIRMFEGRALPLEQPPGQKRAVVWLSRDIT
ncbi:MAG TPA: histidine kinase, partial [Pseudomonas sp.]|nr:histidine kinase [Pseudomonas sp.]